MFGSGAWNGQKMFDFFGVHPYDPYTIDNNCVNSGGLNCFNGWSSQISSTLQQIQQILASKTGDGGVKLFVTEVGLNLTPNGRCNPNQNCVISQNQQAQGMKSAFAAIFGSGVVAEALWYDYRGYQDNYWGIRGAWNGTSFPAVPSTWSMFKSLAGGAGSGNPNACW
jgi:hypothetical protein